MEFVSLIDGVLPIHGFAADFAVLLGSQQGADAAPDHFMIVGDQNFQTFSPSRFSTGKMLLSSS